MNVDDLILVRVDDHVSQPAHMFEDRVPKKHEDGTPRFVRRDELNTMRHFSYDLFAHIPLEEATVAALREQVVGWDVSLQSVRHLRPETASTARAF